MALRDDAGLVTSAAQGQKIKPSVDELWSVLQEERAARLEQQAQIHELKQELEQQRLERTQPSSGMSHDAHEPQEKRVSRAGLLKVAAAGATGLAVGSLGRTEPALAANGDILTAGNSFTETANFVLVNDVGTVSAPTTAISGTAALFVGTDGSQGVQANCYGTAGIAVLGLTNFGIGVYGVSVGLGGSGLGVLGASESGHGVYGYTAGVSMAGVLGQAVTAGATGISGQASVAHSYAGYFTGPVVVAGNQSIMAASGHGLYATTSQASYGAVVGRAAVAGATGISGQTVAGGYAGYFSGPVTIAGNLQVTGSKNAAVPFPDGTHRLVYCMEAPESYFEDVGRGQLQAGKAEVLIAKDFLALIHTDDYYVFLTEHDPSSKGLVVSGMHPDRFVVQEREGGQSNASFSYRIMARRKDIVGERLAKADLPSVVSEPSVKETTIAGAPELPKPHR